MNYRSITLFIIGLLYLIQISYALNELTSYSIGDKIVVECKDKDGVWKDAPKCHHSNEPITFLYGRETYFICDITINSEEELERIKRFSLQEDSWECRIPLSPDESMRIYLPIVIPIWGFSSQHLDINNNYNFVFHSQNGIIEGASIYPVKDKFQELEKGGVFVLKGPIKWFKGKGFDSLNSVNYAAHQVNNADLEHHTLAEIDFWLITLWCLMTLLFSLLFGTLFYKYFLKPRIIKKYLKTD
ncbi:hypothetical protein DLAC_03891 [Tieghemostelium lacteum]|uniref:Transmembrane 9 superfamily member n=1 Tax=Tieghemostelium lacteum TaxID=361077 RepID=A0A152A1G5_TIELA|nr:hypothetical protein DLAC_03891 [Tieghemostelium lacteum]|eukprot:KYQ99924.1 hypothetical protein DLAC_03891 [Tieghemostelium lacteum]